MSQPEATAISSKKLADLLKGCRGHQQDMDSVRGEMGDTILRAVVDYKLDKKVFALIRKLDKMEPEKLAAFMETFDDYFVKAGLKARADSAPSFQIDEHENGADETQHAGAAKPKRGRGKPKRGRGKPKAVEADEDDSDRSLH